MKKLFSVVLSIFFILSASILMPACEKEEIISDGFEPVAEVEFTTNGEQITKNSMRRRYEFSNDYFRSITEDEFLEKRREYYTNKNNVDFIVAYGIDNKPEKIYSLSSILKKEIEENVSSNKTTYIYKSNTNKMCYFAYCGMMRYEDYDYDTVYYLFAEYKIEGTYYEFILVKIIDNQTLQIADKKGITTYTVSSYKLTYFK